mmetsp:Transcript_2578/g.5423  ORF Transcript_2578/g.5423 Transcript_2578/m.5423 type:complete len:277 (+) Transcript_2578:27-857(+)
MRLLAFPALVCVAIVVVWPTSFSTCEDCYSVLGVKATATTVEIRKAWHRESLALHPDKQRGLSTIQWLWNQLSFFKRGILQEDAFLIASRAYETLSDPEKRETHDATLQVCREAELRNDDSRRSLRQNFLQSNYVTGPRGLCALCAETLDNLAERIPIVVVATAFRYMAQLVDGVALFLQEYSFTVWNTPLIALFVLFVITTIVPVVFDAVCGVLMSPYTFIVKVLGLEETAKQRKEIGLKRARERQAETFSRHRNDRRRSTKSLAGASLMENQRA